MPSKFTWRRTNQGQAASSQEPGSLYEDEAHLSRQQRQLETPIYAPGGIFYQVPPLLKPPQANSQNNDMHEGSGSSAVPANPGVEIEEVSDNSNGITQGQFKREQQWQRWNNIIPEMLEPYVSLLRETSSLRNMSSAHNRKLCTGCANYKSSEVLCVYFDSKSSFSSPVSQ